MSEEQNTVPITGRQMVWPPNWTGLGPAPFQQMTIRVKPTRSGSWCLERYAGRAGLWFALAYYMKRDQAFAEAQWRRSRDQVLILCADCGGVLGDDIAMTCSECGVKVFPPEIATANAFNRRSGDFQTRVLAFCILIAALLVLLTLPFGAR